MRKTPRMAARPGAFLARGQGLSGERSVLRRGLRRAVDLVFSRSGRSLLLCLGAIQVGKQVWLLTPPHLYEKDFRQDYCLARALVDRAPLYDPLVEMTRKYVGTDLAPLPSPSPHPPTVAGLLLPLAALPYPAAAALWVGFSLAILAGSLRTIARDLGWRPTPRDLLLLLSAALLWPPVMSDLRYAQLTIPMLASIVASWSSARSGRPTAAGFYLGLGASLKLIPALLVLWLLCKRQWRTAIVAALVFAAFALVPVVRLGGGVWWDYLFRAAPLATSVYHDSVYNYSLYGFIYSLATGHSYARALVGAPTGALTLVVDALVVLVALAVSIRYGDWSRGEVYDLDWSLMVVAMLLVSPVTWLMSLVLLLLPIGVFLRGFRVPGSLVGRSGMRHLLVLLGITAPVEGFRQALQGTEGVDTAPLGAGLALVLSVPNIALIATFAIVCRALLRSGARRANDRIRPSPAPP
jgi:hypothetical protein